jgi:hypothetical protein
LTAGSGDPKAQTKIRRRFMALGQTRDGMRVWDIRRAIQMTHFVRDGDAAKVELRAEGEMGVNALYAALIDKCLQICLLKAYRPVCSENTQSTWVLWYSLRFPDNKRAQG